MALIAPRQIPRRPPLLDVTQNSPPPFSFPGRICTPDPLSSSVGVACPPRRFVVVQQPLDVVRTKLQADAARGVVRSTMATARVVLTEQVSA